MSLQDKVVIIMGASSGIGAATAELMAEKRAKLVLVARRVNRIELIRERFPDAEIIIQKADVKNYEEVQAVIQSAEKTFGKIDVLFNNAGIMPTAPLLEAPREEWQAMLDTNIMGLLNGIAAILPTMVKQKFGHIIGTDSVAGHVVYPDSAVYCGTKFAVRAIMEGLRQEQRQNNIKSTIISPGAVQTELYQTISNKVTAQKLHEAQMDWGLTAEDIASAVAYVIDTPERMSVSNMIIRPTKQEI